MTGYRGIQKVCSLVGVPPRQSAGVNAHFREHSSNFRERPTNLLSQGGGPIGRSPISSREVALKYEINVATEIIVTFQVYYIVYHMNTR